MIHTKMGSKITFKNVQNVSMYNGNDGGRYSLIAVFFIFLDVRDRLRVEMVGCRVAHVRLVAELLLLRIVLLLLRVTFSVLLGFDLVPIKLKV